MLDRRNFLASLANIAALASAPGGGLARAFSPPASCLDSGSLPPLPSKALYDRDEDAFWAGLRAQYVIPKDEVYLNNGTVGSSPYPVLKAVFDAFLESEQMTQTDPED